MKPLGLINGQEIVDIVSSHSNGIRLSRLLEIAAQRFGPRACFHTSCQIGLDIDELLVYMEAHEKLIISKGVVFASSSLARAM
jgi:probable metal-binding protein